ncbi:MAG: PAS domain S-box protein [Proteobacteria bacterium]|nr:PAS domain S-box protein [Pseudomonadota bacterium]
MISRKIGQKQKKQLAILDQLDQGVVIRDASGRVCYLNQMAEQMTGWALQEASSVSFSEVVQIHDVHMKDICSQTAEDILNHIRIAKDGMACVLKPKQGASRIVNVRASMTDSAEKSTPETIVFFQDITEYRKSVSVLEEHVKRQHTIIENTGTAIFIVEKDGILSFVNEGFEKFSGYKREAIIGIKHWKEFISPEDLKKFTDNGHIKINSDIFDPKNYEFDFIDRWGSKKSVYMTITFIWEKECSLVSLIDISKRKRVEKELTKSREHIRKLSKQTELFSLAAASIISMKNEKEIFTSISNAIIEHSGFKRVVISYLKDNSPFRDIIGYGGMDYDIVRKLASVEVPKIWYNDLFEQGIKVGQFSCYLPHSRVDMIGQPRSGSKGIAQETSDNQWHPEDALYVRMNDKKGNLIGVISVDGSKSGKKPTAKTVRPLEIFSSLISQIIINKKTQEETQRLESQLSHANKMESIGTLASGIAHDFNNLLTGILGNASLMNLKTEQADPNHVFIQRIIGLVESGADLTRQILGFARDGKYEVKPTDLNSILQKSADMFARTKREIQIIEEYQDNLWTVDVDRGQIEQLLLNLFVNAAHAMPEGGKIYLKTENVILDKFFLKPYEAKPGKYVKFMVTDTGIGMDKATMQRIFDPFFTTKEMGRGTGLGLASAYGIVKSHEGVINVYSELNEGTTFSIYLPYSGKEIEVALPVDKGIINGKETILLIDDEENIRHISKEMLDLLGYRVILASSGHEGISAFATHPEEIDLVILDMIMPDMGGGETFDRLKEINKDVKVLLASGYSLKGQASHIIQRGCMGFIQKPFGLKELAISVRKVLDEIS